MDDVLREITRLKNLNREMQVKAMLDGNSSFINYSRGFEDALSNIEWTCYGLQKEYCTK